jgi:hypothetical protein
LSAIVFFGLGAAAFSTWQALGVEKSFYREGMQPKYAGRTQMERVVFHQRNTPAPHGF